MSENRVSAEDVPLRQRLAENPRPAAIWLGLGILLLLPQSASILQGLVELLSVFVNLVPGDPGAGLVKSLDTFTASLPTLLSRQVIPNQGYWTGGYILGLDLTILGVSLPLKQFNGTFLGLEPMVAWSIRVLAVYVYSGLLMLWAWNGYTRYREYYRYADWAPRDDVVDRFSNHTWGKFGAFVVFVFVVMAVFSPTLGPTTVEENILFPYSNEIQYYDGGEVKTTPVGVANVQSGSQGTPEENVGIFQYDDYGRFHPFGTTPGGKDLFTFMAEGARVSMTIGITAIALAGLIALAFSMFSAYYKGLADLLIVLTSDSIQALPVLMVLILMMSVFQGTWLAKFYDGALLMIVIFVFTSWPFLWRAIRGPALQVSEEEWIDAAKSFGQKPRVIMQRHMAPYVIGYLLVYTSMSLGGTIIAIAGLSFLGLGINPPTPEWGRIISDGQQYVATWSWHISFVPGILITLLVTGFNALGDGIRDAIDPKSEGGSEGGEAAAAGGGA